MVLDRVDQLNISEGVRSLFNNTSDSFATLTAQTDRPAYRGVAANFCFPLRTHLRQEIGPDESGAAAGGTMNRDTVFVWEADGGVGVGGGGILPFFYVAQRHSRQ